MEAVLRLLLLPFHGNLVVIVHQVCIAIPAVDHVTVRRRRFDVHTTTAFPGAEVRHVVELKEERHHGPGVVESDGVVQVWVVAVRTHELVVRRVADDRYELDLYRDRIIKGAYRAT